MKIVVAPQALKGSLSALEAARAIEQGINRALPGTRIVLLPIADGGDGTLEALVETTAGRPDMQVLDFDNSLFLLTIHGLLISTTHKSASPPI